MRYIYLLHCLVNRKLYVGQTKHPKKRERWHLYSTKSKSTAALPLYRAIALYGPERFVFEVIAECEDAAADALEREWIAKLRTTDPSYGYNNESGGNCAKTITKETRQRMSEAAKRRFASMSDEAKQAWKTSLKKRPPATNEQRQKISAHHKGKKKSDVHREKISRAHLGIGCKLPHELFDEVGQRFLAGESVMSLSRRFSVGRNSIDTALRFLGLKQLRKLQRERRASTSASNGQPSEGQSPAFAAIQ